MRYPTPTGIVPLFFREKDIKIEAGEGDGFIILPAITIAMTTRDPDELFREQKMQKKESRRRNLLDYTQRESQLEIKVKKPLKPVPRYSSLFIFSYKNR